MEATKPVDESTSLTTAAVSNSASNVTISTGDAEKDKKLRNLRKKVQQIEKLMEQQAAGKEMEKNQIDKIQTMDSLLQEIDELEIE